MDGLNYLALLFSIISISTSIYLAMSNYAIRTTQIRFKITGKELHHKENNWSVFLIRLSFLNASDIGRVIFDLDFELTGGYLVERLLYKYNPSKYFLKYPHQNEIYIPLPDDLPKNDILLMPLNVAPRSSVMGWIALAISGKDNQPLEIGNEIHLHVYACNFDGKRIENGKANAQTILIS